MTSVEAVNLLLALNGASSPKHASDAVMRLRQLYTKAEAVFLDGPLDKLGSIASFGKALEYLIEEFPAIAAFYNRDVHKADEYFFDAFSIHIEIHVGYAIIRLKRDGNKRDDFNRSYHLPISSMETAFARYDRRIIVHLSGKTIFALWQCIADGTGLVA